MALISRASCGSRRRKGRRPARRAAGSRDRSISARAISRNRSSLCCSRSARTSASASRPTHARASRAPCRSMSLRPRDGAAATAATRRSSPLPLDRAANHDILQHRRFADHAAASGRCARCPTPHASVAASPAAAQRRPASRAGFGGVEAGDDVQRRGLAAAVRADQPMDLARARPSGPGRRWRARRRS